MPRFLDLEAKEGSVTRGLRAATSSPGRSRPFGHGTGRGGFVALGGGLTRLVDALIARLPAGSVRLGARAAGISAAPGAGGWEVRLADGEAIRAAAVLVACPAEPAAEALAECDAPLAEELRGLRYASCATVNIAYRKEDVGARLEGLGFFVPRTERLPILACSYVSEKFAGRAPGGVALFRAFLGGATRPQALNAADDVLVRETHESLRRILAIRADPVFAKAYRSPDSMPQFGVGASAAIGSIRDRAASHPGLFLAGSIVGAYGLPDCIRSGEDAADRAVKFLDGVQGVADEEASVPGSSGWVAYQANQ
jgi:oxygen-dependent protoporphyrinogen oxidase